MLFQFFLILLQLCRATEGMWTADKFSAALAGKNQIEVLTFFEHELIGKVFSQDSKEETRAQALAAWLDYSEKNLATEKEITLENSKILLGSILSRGGGITPLMAKEMARYMSVESHFTKVAMESAVSYPFESKKVIFDKSVELLETGEKYLPLTREIAHQMRFYSSSGNNQYVINPKSAALLLKNGVIDEEIVTTALNQKPYPVSELLASLKEKGSYKVPQNSADTLEDKNASFLAPFLGLLAAGEVKLSDAQIAFLKQVVLDKENEPTRREIVYHTLLNLNAELVKPLMKELMLRKEPAEQFFALELMREEPGFDKSRYFDILNSDDSLINYLVTHRTLKQSPNNLLSLWLQRDLPGFVSTISNMEKNKVPMLDVLLYELANEDGLKAVREKLQTDSKLSEALAERILMGGLGLKTKKLILDMLKESNSPKLPFILLNEMQMSLPFDAAKTDDIDYDRRALYENAEVLKAFLEKHPETVTKEFTNKVATLLLDPSTDKDASRTAIRKALPKLSKDILEREVAVKQTHESNADACSVRCRLVRHYADNWDKIKFGADQYYGSTRDQNPWKLAVKAKAIELLFVAGQDCGINLKEKIIKEITFKSEASVKTPDKTDLQYLRSEANPDVLAFLNHITDPVKDELPPHSPFIFAISHLGQLLNRIQPEMSAEERASILSIREKTQSWLSKVNQKAQVLSDGNTMGSVLGSYHYAALNLGYDSQLNEKELQSAIAKMKAERDLSLKIYKSAQRVGYYLSFQKAPKASNNDPVGETALSPSIRASSARMVPFNLVLYKNSTPEDKKQNVEYLLESLHNYQTYFQDNWAGRGEYRTHEKYDKDYLAPYFGPATVSYAFDAIRLLMQDKELAKDQKQELEDLSKGITAQLLSKFTDGGLLSEQNTTLYSGANDYENVFAGLALQDACLIQKQTRNNLENFLPHMTGIGTSH